MSKIIIAPNYLKQLSELDASIEQLNAAKLRLIMELLSLHVSDQLFETMLQWDIIHITVKDRQMAVQLNKLSAYMPKLLFVVASEEPLFTYRPGPKTRRIYKER